MKECRFYGEVRISSFKAKAKSLELGRWEKQERSLVDQQMN